MTSRRRETPETVAMRFLLEEFIDVADADDGRVSEAAAEGVVRLQREAVRTLLPGPKKGSAGSIQQLQIAGLSADEFQELRRKVRAWLRSLVTSRITGKVTLEGPLILRVPALAAGSGPDRRGAPMVEGSARDVFWYYLV